MICSIIDIRQQKANHLALCLTLLCVVDGDAFAEAFSRG